MDLFILYRSLLPIAGVCLGIILLTAWAQRRSQGVNRPGFLAPVLKVALWVGILVLVLDLGWLGGYWLAEVKRPMHITAPFNDQAVNLRQQVLGTSREIPAGQTLWVFVAPHRTPIYSPQQSPAIIQPDGAWSSLTFVGSAGDKGKVFDIVLALVDQQGQQAIHNYLAANSQNGLDGLPPGATIVDKLTVWRK
jgi:hypothetical protein